MVKIKQQIVPESKYDIKCPYTMVAEYITIHNTANDTSAQNEVDYMTGNNNEVSFHYAVDDIQAIQAILTNRNAWHAGDGGSGKGNRASIGIEICYSEYGGDKYDKAEANAAELTAQLLQEYGFGIDRVKQHNFWSGKNCPHRIREEGTWDAFLAKVQSHMNGEVVAPPPPSPPTQSSGSGKVAPTPTLKKGSKGQEVKELQSILGGLTVDGDFGTKTESALKEWQKGNGLTADGIYGTKSQAKMQAMLDGEGTKPVQTKTTYRVYANGKWYGWITGYNDTNSNGYAGVVGAQIMGVQIQGDVEYRVRTTDGKWWSWIKGYNTSNSNGYAGTLNKPIDAIQIKDKTYRVSPVKSNYLGWITHYNTTNGNGYAGIYGKPIDRLQIK